MAKNIESRLDVIENKIRTREPLNKFDVFWMVRRLRAYEEQMSRAAKAVEKFIPGVGELDPTEIGNLVEVYMGVLDKLLQLEQKRGTLARKLPSD
jgi:hypothetical protein